MSKLLIVIPAHNEEENIASVVEDLTTRYPQYDYIVVNDGSRDKTAAICRARGYHLIDLPVNLGLAGAFQAGLKYAYRKHYACAIQYDADGRCTAVAWQGEGVSLTLEPMNISTTAATAALVDLVQAEQDALTAWAA